MEKVFWNDRAEPLSAPLPTILYQLRTEDSGYGLMLDAVTMDELMADPDIEAVPVFDAMVAQVGLMQPKMEALQRIMASAGETVKPTEMTLSDPVRYKGAAQVMALFTMSDGQTVAIWFHNPDTTPAKLTPLDMMTSWKWMLNKKDVTIVVAPEKGKDLNAREVARRIMKLVEKNSAAFTKANAKVAEKAAQLQALDDEIAGLETELKDVQRQIEMVKIERETAPVEDAKNDHYSDLTLNALMGMGWSAGYFEGGKSTGRMLSVSREFVGVGAMGGSVVPDGMRRMFAGYNTDQERRRYIALTLGETQIEELDGRDRDPAEVARLINDAAEKYADESRAKNGLPALYAKAAPAAPTALERAYAIAGILMNQYGWSKSDENEYPESGIFVDSPRGMNWVKLWADGVELRIDKSRSLLANPSVDESVEAIAASLDAGDARAAEPVAPVAPAEPAAPAQHPVDAVYKFNKATEAFKNSLIGSLDSDSYSPFYTSKSIDEAVKRNGGTIAWDLTTVFDSVSEADEDDDEDGDWDAESEFDDWDGDEDEDKDEDGVVFDSAYTGEKKFNPKTDRWVTTGTGSRLLVRGERVIGGAGGKLNGQNKHGVKEAFTTKPSRFAKGHVLVNPLRRTDGYITSVGAIAEDIGGRYSRREGGYTMPASKVKLLEHLVNAGATTNSFSRTISIGEKRNMSLPDAKKHLKTLGYAFDDAALDSVEELFILGDADVYDSIVGGDWDGEDEDGAVFDGDFKGHPFRGNQYKKASRESGTAVGSSMRAKHAEKHGDKKAQKKAHKAAYYANMAAAQDAKGKAKSYHRKMAKFHAKRGGVTLDGVFDSIASGEAHTVVSLFDGVAMSARAEVVDVPMFQRPFGAKQVAFVDWGTKSAILVDVTPAERAEFGPGVFRTGKGELPMQTLVKLDPKGMKVYMLDEAAYAEDGVAQWGQPVKLKKLMVHDLAKFTAAFRAKVLDGVTVFDEVEGYEEIVGVIKKGARIVGRAHVDGDGKAMVFLGKKGKDRVKIKSFRNDGELIEPSMWVDDDAGYLVDALFTVLENGVAKVAPVAPVPAAPVRSTQFLSYMAAINEGKASPGMLEQIRTDARLEDGEAEILAAEAQRVMPAPAAPVVAAEPEPVAPVAAVADNDLKRLDVLMKKAPKEGEAVRSDDPNAIEKLGAKLDYLIAYGDMMRKANKLVRKKDRAGLAAMGFSGAVLEGLFKPDFAGRIGFADYMMTNNNGVIRTTRLRLEELEAAERARYAQAPEPAPEPAPQPTPAMNPQKAADTAYLNSLINGEINLLSTEIFDKLEPMFTTYEADPEMMALLEKAAEVYGDAAIAAAKQALADMAL